MDRLLRGEIPPGGKCYIKTIATASGVKRAALYSIYLHLKEKFERRRDQLRDTGVIPDPRDQQIERLKRQVDLLKKRLAAEEQQKAELTAFRVHAVSQLATQHEEIARLRATLAARGVVRSLPTRPGPS